MSPRQAARAGRAGRWSLVLAFALSIALASCTLPGRRVESSTATAVGVAVASPVGTAAIAGSPPPLAAAPATPASPRAATASPRPATPSPTAGTPAAGRGTASPGGGTARAGATPTHAPFAATKDEPCHETERKEAPLPEKPATAATIEQAYRCFLRHYVDHATMDHRVLLNGAWDYLAQAGQGLFTADDTAPLALTGDREADWTVFAGRYNALAKKYSRVDPALLARVTIDGMARSLKDNHVAYLEPPQWQRAYAEEVGQNTVIGPGFEIAIDDPTGKFYLHDVYPNTPAAAAGLKAGDIIVQVGGRPAAKGTGNNALFDLLTGPVGTSATLQVTRPSTGQTVNARVTVAQVEVPLITSRVLPGGS